MNTTHASWQLRQQLVVNHFGSGETCWNWQWQRYVLAFKHECSRYQRLVACLVGESHLQVLLVGLQRSNVHIIPFGREGILLNARVPINWLTVGNRLFHVLIKLIHLCAQREFDIGFNHQRNIVQCDKLAVLIHGDIQTIIISCSNCVCHSTLRARNRNCHIYSCFLIGEVG